MPITRLLVSNTPVKNRVVVTVMSDNIIKFINNFLLMRVPSNPAIKGTVISGTEKFTTNHITSIMSLLMKINEVAVIDIKIQAVRAINSSCLSVRDGHICLHISCDINADVVFKNES